MFWEGKGKVDDKGPGTDDVEGGGRGEGGPKEKENEKLICVKKI